MAVSDLSNAAIFHSTNLRSAVEPVIVHLSGFRLLYGGKKIIRAMEFSYYWPARRVAAAVRRDAIRLDCVYGSVAAGDVKSCVAWREVARERRMTDAGISYCCRAVQMLLLLLLL